MNPISFPFPTPPDQDSAIEIAPRILWMRISLPMALNHVNVYALDDGAAGWTLIDTGMDCPQARAQWQELLAGPLGGRPVHRVVVTHHHMDHMGLAGWFQAQGATLLTSRVAWLTGRMLQLDVQDRPSPEMLRHYARAGMPAAMIEARRDQRPFNTADTTMPLPLGYQRLSEGDRITMGGITWDVRLGSGHAPDHLTFWSDDIVITADQVIPGISPNISVTASEPEADPLADWLESCQRLAAFATEGQLALPGHKLPFYGLPRRLRQQIDGHTAALERLEAFLSAPRSAVDCFSLLFKREVTEPVYFSAMGEALAHLNHLWHQGRVHRALDAQGTWRWTKH